MSLVSRLALALVVLASASASAQAPQSRPSQADGIVRLLADLETALLSGRVESLRSLASPSLPADEAERFSHALAGGTITAATVRERGRLPVGGGYEVIADVFVASGRHGRIATWQFSTAVRPDAPDRHELTRFSEVASIDGLLRLTLDRTQQFSVHNLTFQAPDLTLKMASGSAFVAESSGGVTAIVLRGKGELHFAPADPAEQGQLRIFARRPFFTQSVDEVFIRLSPGELDSRLSEKALVPVKVNAGELARAQTLFDAFAPRTFNLDLRDLTNDQWSLEPSFGNIVVEFKAGRFGWLTYARAPGEQEDISFFDRARTKNISAYASAENRAKRGRASTDDEDGSYDAERYSLDLAFDPDRNWISGRGSIRLRVRAGAVQSLTLRLAQSLNVSAISSPTLGRLLALRVIGQHNLLVSLPRAVERGTELTIDVLYSGRLEPQMLDREALTVSADDDDDAQGTSRQDPDRPDTPIQPEPRYMYSNRVPWYPQSGTGDYALAVMRLTVPSEYQIVASGSFVSTNVAQVESAGRRGELRSVRTVEYSADRPARYLACVISRFVPVGRTRVDVPAVAPPLVTGLLDRATAGTPSVSLEVVSTPRMTGRNRQLTTRLADIVGFFAKTIGEAPYPDLTVAAIDDNLPGGHSPAYFAIWHQILPTTPYSWSDDPVAFNNVPFFFLAHEVAHQWWGQAVGWRNYHEQWLSEGLAQYFAVLYSATERDRGPEIERQLIGQMRTSAAAMTDQGPISLGYRLGHLQGEGRIFRAIVYNKSAVVLHMLRLLIGDAAFFNGVRRFYTEWRFRRASTDDLRAVMEAETPMRLGRFFEKWIRGSTLPRLRVKVVVAENGASAEVRVEQLGDVFDVPVVIALQYDDGQVEDVVVAVTEANVVREVPLKRPVKRIAPREELTLAEFVK